MKTLLIWTLGLTVTFSGFMAAVYLNKDKLYPPATRSGPDRFDPRWARQDSLTRAKIDSLKFVISELLGQLQKLVETTKALEDSLWVREEENEHLATTIAGLETTVDSLSHTIETIKSTQVKVQDLTKTLGAMKVDVLRPIMANLSDEVIQILYDKAKSKDKRKIFSALPPERASRILKHLTRNLNES